MTHGRDEAVDPVPGEPAPAGSPAEPEEAAHETEDAGEEATGPDEAAAQPAQDEPFDTAVAQPAQDEPFDTAQDKPFDTAQDKLAVTEMALAERTADLQRLQAEFLNYKRRVERDRDLVRENATYTALVPIIEVLDTIDRAREHGELHGGFKAVAEQLERTVTKLGLTRFGEVGDEFDPNIHEALSHIGTDPEVQVTTCQHIAKAGYRIGDRVVRAAQVLVVDPAEPSEDDQNDE